MKKSTKNAVKFGATVGAVSSTRVNFHKGVHVKSYPGRAIAVGTGAAVGYKIYHHGKAKKNAKKSTYKQKRR